MEPRYLGYIGPLGSCRDRVEYEEEEKNAAKVAIANRIVNLHNNVARMIPEDKVEWFEKETIEIINSITPYKP